MKYTAVELHVRLNHFESSGIFLNALKEIYHVRTMCEHVELSAKPPDV